MSGKKFIIYTLIAVIFFLFGFVVAKISGGDEINTDNMQVNTDNTYQAGWDAAKERLIETGVIRENNHPIKLIDAIIKNKNNSKLTVELSYPLEPLANPVLDERVISINNNTEIIKETRKPKDQYNKETEEYNNIIRNSPELLNTLDFPSRPSVCESNLVDISQLESGQTIKVESSEDIKNEKQFIASKIIVSCQ